MESNDLMNGAHNVNLSAKRKKLEPISNSVNIYDLRKLMGSWKQAGITYAQMFKVLRLPGRDRMDGYRWQISLQQPLSDS